MKKIFAMLLALMLVMSMSVCALATEAEEPTTPETQYEDMTTVTLTKEYKLTNDGTTSPAETFEFSELTCTGVENAGVGVTKDNAPVPTIANVEYQVGEAGSNTATKEITITLPPYTAVGIYTYTFTELDNNTAGVTYRGEDIKLVVTVIQQGEDRVRVAAVHTEVANGKKTNKFDNTYSAGSLSVRKNVTGLLGDRKKDFKVKVTFTAPAGDIVKSDISYVKGTTTNVIEAGEGWTTKEVEITLKHDETITFTNIPYGVTYTVVEDSYTSEGYDAAAYAFDDENKKIDTATESVTITNNKGGEVDTGITVDSMPYVVLLGVVTLLGAAMLLKRRAVND